MGRRKIISGGYYRGNLK